MWSVYDYLEYMYILCFCLPEHFFYYVILLQCMNLNSSKLNAEVATIVWICHDIHKANWRVW
jgi:hypothetical protein